MNKSNQQRVEKWKAQKVVEWEKGGKLREKYETREELDKWMEGQINKAKKRVLAPKAKNPKVLVRGKTSNDPEVTWEDQQNINAYGRLNQRMMELEDDIKAKKKLAQEIEDGIAELEALIDDDACKILIGECYVQVSNEEAEEFVEEKKKLADAELSVLREEETELIRKMETLKAILKGKFGDSINLDPTGNDEDHLRPKK